jgi:hypothetical protein
VALIASIDNPNVKVEPGGESSCQLHVENRGMVVDRVLVDVLGDAREWATVEPEQLNLLPATGGSVRVAFRPPRSPSVRAGAVPFAVRAMSQEDPAGSVIEEGAVTVGGFTEVGAQMVPRTSQGRRRARHRLTVENRGNEATQLALSAADPDDALEFRFTPDLISAEPGTATFVRLRVAPRKRFLKGPSRSLPFQAFARRDGAEPVTVDGTMLQRQAMPEWLLPAIGVAAAVVAALVAIWFLVFKPEVHSAATQAVSDQTQRLASNASKASQAADRADQAAESANSAAGVAGGGGAGGRASTPDSTPGSTPNAPSGQDGTPSSHPSATRSPTRPAAARTQPVSTLLESNTKPGAAGNYPYRLPAGWTALTVSDIVVENPAGDTGTLQIRSGTSPLFEFALADFRNLDYHFVQPLSFDRSKQLTLVVDCKNPQATNCTAGFSFSGQLQK